MGFTNVVKSCLKKEHHAGDRDRGLDVREQTPNV